MASAALNAFFLYRQTKMLLQTETTLALSLFFAMAVVIPMDLFFLFSEPNAKSACYHAFFKIVI
jgi:hypothetical protein